MDWGLFTNFTNTEQVTEYVCDHFRWLLRDPMDPGPRPLLMDYHGLCPHFDLEVARRYAHDYYIPEMVQIVFYAMAYHGVYDVGYAKVGLRPCRSMARGQQSKAPKSSGPSSNGPPADPVLAGGPSRGRTSSFPSFRDTVQAVEYLRDNLCWSKREMSSFRPNLLTWNFSAYCPEFNHIATHIPELVQSVFYAMVINDAARLWLIRRETGESLMSDGRKLRWDVIEA
ncbi:hypothetical protein Cgig2_017063 [Carnegiea gigantea]|uniref:Uncharacterized protein n=1 Tax=Carnegiea gigantea TaxID=171969 RepID=A0A9Q1Q6L9_9CARY|nr:hypothetical protein Cgig2_017063 [Carnegiea gigantea]